MATSSASPIAAAVRGAAAFDRRAIAPGPGLLAAVPVVVLLGSLIAAGQPVAAVTATVGAMFVGIAWRVNGGRPPFALMTTDAVLMALATIAGCVSGNVLWVHLVVLGLWSLAGGSLVGLGRAGGIVGFQSILAVVVFGRFAEPFPQAAGLGGLVCVGGLAQVVFLSVVRWPTPLAMQRRATAAALRQLGELALGSAQTSALPAAAALDEAEASLAGWSLLGASAVTPLRSLVTEGHRMRVAIAALNGLAGRLAPSGPAADDVHEIATETGWALRIAAAAVEGEALAADDLSRVTRQVSLRVTELQRGPVPEGEPADLWPVLLRRLAALTGQLRAVANLVPDAARATGLRARRRQTATRRSLREQLHSDLDTLRANLSLQSPATRHAVRLMIVVPGAELLARQLPVQRGYWVVVAAAAVLRPEFGATFTRGAERAGGTALGVLVAGLIAVALHPGEVATVVLVGVFAWAAYATFAASYAVGFACITGLVVFLLNTLAPDTVSVASARLVDTLIGGTLGLLLFAAWPTWARPAAQESLAELVDAVRRYLSLVLGALVSGEPLSSDIRAYARAARLARTRAESDVARSLSEPAGHRIDARVGTGMLGELQRLVHAAHALRLDAAEDERRAPLPRLSPLARAVDVQLASVSRALVTPELQLSQEHIDLRQIGERFTENAGPAERALFGVLDELVDAANSVAELVARG
jgi:hypothetical protein